MHGKKLLVVDDDVETRILLRHAFERNAATVLTASSGEEALRIFFEHRPHVVLLDVMMPGMSGWNVLRRIRELSSVPVLLLTVRDREQDILRGFALGADDYVVKPFKVKVLEARVAALLRRFEPEADEEDGYLYDDGYLNVNARAQRVRVEGKTVSLTPTEFDLLACLLRRRGGLCTYRQILSEVWGQGETGSVEAVHAFVWQLRQKIEPNPKEPIYVVSVRGVGYRFEPAID